MTALFGGGALSLELVLLGAGAWGGIAAVATAGVGVFLAVGGPRSSLSELSAAKAGLFGLIGGAVAPFLLISGIKVVLLCQAPTITMSLAVGMAIGGVLSGSLGAGLVTVGEKAEADLLEEADGALLGSGG